MTYKELANQILQLSDNQQNMKVVRFDGNMGVFFNLEALSMNLTRWRSDTLIWRLKCWGLTNQ
jgi:hypothetical protein